MMSPHTKLQYVFAKSAGIALILGACAGTSLSAPVNFEGAGSLTMGSASVMEEGAFVWFLPVLRENFPDEVGTTTDIPWGVRAGIAPGWELGARFPYRSDSELEKDGLRHIELSAKVQLFGGPRAQRSGALALFGTVVNSEGEPFLGTGRANMGIEFLVTEVLSTDTRFHSSIGLARRDIRAPYLEATDPDYDPEAIYQITRTLSYKMGLEQRLWKQSYLLLEAGTSIGLAGEDEQDQFSIYVMPGLRFGNPAAGWNLTMAVGRDIPENGLEPESRYMLGLSYRTQPARATQDDELRKRLEELEKRLAAEAALDQDPAAGALLPGAAAPAATGRLRVEVINASGVPLLGERIAEEVRQKGNYDVIRVGSTGNVTDQELTHIHYRNGLARDAVTLGHSMRNYQIVTQGRDLPEDVDLRIVIGVDQFRP